MAIDIYNKDYPITYTDRNIADYRLVPYSFNYEKLDSLPPAKSYFYTNEIGYRLKDVDVSRYYNSLNDWTNAHAMLTNSEFHINNETSNNRPIEVKNCILKFAIIQPGGDAFALLPTSFQNRADLAAIVKTGFIDNVDVYIYLARSNCVGSKYYNCCLNGNVMLLKTFLMNKEHSIINVELDTFIIPNGYSLFISYNIIPRPHAIEFWTSTIYSQRLKRDSFTCGDELTLRCTINCSPEILIENHAGEVMEE